MTNESPLIADRPHEGVLLLTLNRPHALNAVTIELADALADALREAEQDDELRAIVLTGAGERAFCTGYDIREMAELDRDGMLVALLQRCGVIRALARHKKPVIAALHGLAHGVGALYAMAADIRIATPQTEFCIAAVHHGAAEGAWQLPQLIGAPRAKEILLSGRRVAADEGLAIGLYHRIVEREQLLATALTQARDIAAMPPLGVQWLKRLIDEGVGRSLDDQFRAEQMALATEMRPPSGRETFKDFLAKRRSA